MWHSYSTKSCLVIKRNEVLTNAIVQLLSRVRFFVTPWTAALQASLSFIISQSLRKLMSIELGCHPNISSSVVPFFSCLQSFSASESFPMSWLFSSGGQSIGSFSFNICIHHSASFQWIFRINTCYWYMLDYEQSWNFYAKLKSSDTKQHILCDSIWIISREMSRQIHTDRKHISCCHGLREKEVGSDWLMGTRFILKVMKITWNYIVGDGSTLWI